MLDVVGLQARTDNAFRSSLFSRATESDLNPDYIAAVMALESGFDPNVQNKGGAPALGLIQFWRDYFPQIAARAGRPDVQWDALRSMSAVDQVPFVIAYYQGTRVSRESSPTDYYMATFMPAFVGKPPSFELGRRDSTEQIAGLSKAKVYAQNAGLDSDRDGSITVGDVGKKIESIVATARQRPRVSVVLFSEGDDGSPPSSAEPTGPLIAGMGGVLFFCRSCGSRSEAVGVELAKPGETT